MTEPTPIRGVVDDERRAHMLDLIEETRKRVAAGDTIGLVIAEVNSAREWRHLWRVPPGINAGTYLLTAGLRILGFITTADH